jgi:hypothetical protein
MAEVIGKIVNIKVGSFLPDTVNSFDIGTITVLDNATPPVQWLFYLWNSRDAEPALRRILQSQRLALAREAAFRKLTVHINHQSDSSIVDSIQVDIS